MTIKIMNFYKFLYFYPKYLFKLTKIIQHMMKMCVISSYIRYKNVNTRVKWIIYSNFLNIILVQSKIIIFYI